MRSSRSALTLLWFPSNHKRANFGYAQAIRSGDLIHVSGQIVSQTLYVVDPRRNATPTAEGNLAYFGGHRPVSTVVGVTELTFPGQVVEISRVVDTRLPAPTPSGMSWPWSPGARGVHNSALAYAG